MKKRYRYKVILCGICVLACMSLLFCVLRSSCTRVRLDNDLRPDLIEMPTFVDRYIVEQVLMSLPVTFEGFYQELMSIGSPWVLNPSNTNTLRVFYHPIGLEVDTSPLDNDDWIDGFRENAKYLFKHIEDLEEVSFSFFFTPLGKVLKFDEFDYRFTTSRLGVAEGEMLSKEMINIMNLIPWMW